MFIKAARCNDSGRPLLRAINWLIELSGRLKSSGGLFVYIRKDYSVMIGAAEMEGTAVLEIGDHTVLFKHA